jgi:hypothetical protein
MKKKSKGTNLKVSPLKKFKKSVKRMKNRMIWHQGEAVPDEQQLSKYKARLAWAEDHLLKYDKEQEKKKADEMKAAAAKKKV